MVNVIGKNEVEKLNTGATVAIMGTYLFKQGYLEK